MKQITIILFLFLSVGGKAQSQQLSLESLRLALQKAPNDTIRMDVLSKIGFYYFHIDIDSSDFYLAQSSSMAEKLNLQLYVAGILSSQAYNLSWSNYPKALDLSLRALKIAEDPASDKNVWNVAPGHTANGERLSTLGWTYFNVAQLYGNTDNVGKQISSLRQAKSIADSLKDSVLNMLVHLNLGNIYLEKLSKEDSALIFELKALSFFSEPNGDKSDIGWVFGTIGNINADKGNFTLAGDAYYKGLQSMQEENNLAGSGSFCLSLSGFYNKIHKPDSSLFYAYKALETYSRFKDSGGIANAYSSLSSAYGEQKQTDSTLAYLQLATAVHDRLNNAERKNLLTYQNKNFDEQMRVKNLEDEKIETRTKIKTYAMLAGIAICLVIAFLLYRNNRNRKKANDLLEQQKEEIAKQKDTVEQTLSELKSTQAQLIQSEKMASLGELTAGIAHEIQNPLNFVNNFSEVNKELIEELKIKNEELKIEDKEVKELLEDISANEEKINYHGKRADSIVKGMLQHSRSSVGAKESTDINALCDEYLRLSYHGLRVKDKEFNADFKTDFDESIGTINIIPQDIGRVLLNLYNNAFYAVKERVRKAQPDIHYKPTVSVSTKKTGNRVSITVRDNGNGIPQSNVDKIFQPFFTTKPTGQGTGLGLSLSYDIMKAHGGEIKVESKEGEGSEFILFFYNK